MDNHIGPVGLVMEIARTCVFVYNLLPPSPAPLRTPGWGHRHLCPDTCGNFLLLITGGARGILLKTTPDHAAPFHSKES